VRRFGTAGRSDARGVARGLASPVVIDSPPAHPAALIAALPWRRAGADMTRWSADQRSNAICRSPVISAQRQHRTPASLQMSSMSTSAMFAATVSVEVITKRRHRGRCSFYCRRCSGVDAKILLHISLGVSDRSVAVSSHNGSAHEDEICKMCHHIDQWPLWLLYVFVKYNGTNE